MDGKWTYLSTELKSSTVDKLEAKYHRNIMNMLDDIPPLSVMLTIIQGSHGTMAAWNELHEGSECI